MSSVSRTLSVWHRAVLSVCSAASSSRMLQSEAVHCSLARELEALPLSAGEIQELAMLQSVIWKNQNHCEHALL